MTGKLKAATLFSIGLAIALVSSPRGAVAQAIDTSAGSPTGIARAYRRAHAPEVMTEFFTLLAIPNVASDTANIRHNAELLVSMLERRDLHPRVLPSGPSGGSPAVYGEWLVPGAKRTLVLYAHYDGQPTDPVKWTRGQPWTPTLRNAALDSVIAGPAVPADTGWRIYARSASDDKGGVMAILTALDGLKAAGRAPGSNIKLFLEGEEEAGSPHFGEMLSRFKGPLVSDAWIMVDGPVHQSGAKQVVFGARGDMNVDVTVFGPKRPLHSGHYGNWAPNPAMRLARLLASMTDETGRVTIAGWYDDVEPLGEAERRANAAAPRYDDEIRRELGIARSDGSGRPLADLIALPSLNVNGFASAEVGAGARNVIPTSATAVLDLRLVKGNDFERQFGRLVEHIKRQGYLVLDRPPSDAERAASPLIAQVVKRPGAYNASRTPMNLRLATDVVTAIRSTTDRPVVLVPTSGGSAPLVFITERLGAPSLMVPIANYDNNQHAEDENLRLANFWEGVETLTSLLIMP